MTRVAILDDYQTVARRMADVTDEGYRIFNGQALEDVKAWLAGQPVRLIRP